MFAHPSAPFSRRMTRAATDAASKSESAVRIYPAISVQQLEVCFLTLWASIDPELSEYTLVADRGSHIHRVPQQKDFQYPDEPGLGNASPSSRPFVLSIGSTNFLVVVTS